MRLIASAAIKVPTTPGNAEKTPASAQVGDKSVDEALEAAQAIALESVTKSGLRN